MQIFRQSLLIIFTLSFLVFNQQAYALNGPVNLACPVKADFSISQSHPALLSTVIFTNTSTNAVQYRWLVNNIERATTVNYTPSFNIAGVYTISLIAQDNICSDTMTQQIYVGCLDEHKRADNWYFGNHAALSFASGSPVAISGSALSAHEGISTISDPSGNLLFYSDGVTVWNRNHTPMPNGTGLLGSPISAQSSIVIPKPNNSNQYYLFTVPNWTDNHSELSYNIIDMTLNGGLGDVIPAFKNIILNNNVAEQLTAAYHNNCKDIWIVAHEKNNAKYVVYAITAAGVSTTPVVSSVGNNYDGANRYGSLRMSHSGKKICFTSGGNSSDNKTASLVDFNATTGVISNPIYLETTTTMFGAYTSEFSSDDRFLYVAAYNDVLLKQYDLSQSDIPASAFTIQTNGTQVNVLQMGPDSKIYAGIMGGGLSTIQFPNAKGNACGFTSNNVGLIGNCEIGLPNFFPGYFQKALTLTSTDSVCENSSTLVHLVSSQCNSTYQWSITTGNGSITVLNDTLIQFTSGNNSGLATIQCIRTTDCGKDTTIKNIFIKMCNICPLPVVVNNDTTICSSNSVPLVATTGYDNYTWLPVNGLPNAGIRTPNATPTITTKYVVTATTIGGCTSKDSILITVNNPTTTTQTFTGCGSYTYKGTPYTGSTIVTENLKTSKGCDSTVTTNIVINTCVCPTVTVNNDTTICKLNSVQLLATQGFDNYSWFPATGLNKTNVYNPIATVAVATKYIVTASMLNGCSTKDSVIIDLFTPAIGSQDLFACNAYSYKGTNYTTSIVLKENLLSSHGCDSTLTTNIIIKSPSTSTTDKNICNNQLPYLWNGQNFGIGKHSVTLVNAQGCDSVATLNLSLVALPVPDLGIDQTVCSGGSIVISPGKFSDYTWQDGSKLDHYTVTKNGLYSVTVSNECGSTQDQISITEKNCKVFFPNAFSPNNDPLNKTFKALNAYNLQEFELQIYNRWGQLVFETKDCTQGWDGTFGGKEQPEGYYVWWCKYLKSNGTIKGGVMLLR